MEVSGAKLAERYGGEILVYESMNLVEGKRTTSEIRDVIRLLRSVPLSEMPEYMDLLSKSKAMGQARPMGNGAEPS